MVCFITAGCNCVPHFISISDKIRVFNFHCRTGQGQKLHLRRCQIFICKKKRNNQIPSKRFRNYHIKCHKCHTLTKSVLTVVAQTAEISYCQQDCYLSSGDLLSLEMSYVLFFLVVFFFRPLSTVLLCDFFFGLFRSI